MRHFGVSMFLVVGIVFGVALSGCGLADKCPGKVVCNDGCMPEGADCCSGGGYCDEGRTCGADNLCHATSGGGGGGGTTGNGCQPGFCNSNGGCCPTSARYYCEGACYSTSTQAATASAGRCTSFRIQCP